MSPAEVIAIMQLVNTLAPPAIRLANNLIDTFNNSDIAPAERLKMLNELTATLKPMELKP
jgi:hypothetical protein